MHGFSDAERAALLELVRMDAREEFGEAAAAVMAMRQDLYYLYSL